MRITRDGRFERTDLWREGKWVDLWSVVHLLTGVSTALGLSLFGFGFLASTVIAFLAFTAYELWEAMVKIAETPQNRFMDVVAGLASFVPVFVLAEGLPVSNVIALFFAVLFVNVVMAWLGWRASQKADEFEKRLRAKIISRKERLLLKESRIRGALKRGIHISDS